MVLLVVVSAEREDDEDGTARTECRELGLAHCDDDDDDDDDDDEDDIVAEDDDEILPLQARHMISSDEFECCVEQEGNG